MSTRTFYTDLWPAVRDALKPGDWVIVSIGHNDNGEFFDQRRARAVIPGVDPDTCYVGFNQRTQRQDTVYSYGYYLRCYINEVRAKGANPILMSLTPRDAYDDKGKIVRKPQTEWAAYVAATEGYLVGIEVLVSVVAPAPLAVGAVAPGAVAHRAVAHKVQHRVRPTPGAARLGS